MSTEPATNESATPRSKGVLFCPTCGHESPATGDWVVRERRGRAALTCPECDATVTALERIPQPAD